MSGRRFTTVAALLAAFLLPAQVVHSQATGVAAAAEKEKERRKKAKGTSTAKTYTDKDLPAPSSTETPGQGQDATANVLPSPSPTPAAGEGRSPARNEAYWRNRAEGLRGAIATAEARVKKAEEDLAGTPRPNSQPLPTDVVTPEGGLAQLPPDPGFNPAAVKLQKELDDAKAALAVAQKALQDFEEEARKAGVPPGWLR